MANHAHPVNQRNSAGGGASCRVRDVGDLGAMRKPMQRTHVAAASASVGPDKDRQPQGQGQDQGPRKPVGLHWRVVFLPPAATAVTNLAAAHRCSLSHTVSTLANYIMAQRVTQFKTQPQNSSERGSGRGQKPPAPGSKPAGAQGLEPQLTEPESVVLPITPRPNRSLKCIILATRAVDRRTKRRPDSTLGSRKARFPLASGLPANHRSGTVDATAEAPLESS